MGEQETRLLVVTPTAKDAELSRGLLSAAGLPCALLPDVPAACAALEAGAGAVLLTEESLAGEGASRLAAALGRQPPWSDLPILVLTRGGADSAVAAHALEVLGNVTLLERPVRRNTLLSAVRSALRARDRQYELMRHLEEERRSADATRRRSAQLQALASAATRLNAAPDVGAVLRVITEEACTLVYAFQAVATAAGAEGTPAVSAVSVAEKPGRPREDGARPDRARVWTLACKLDKPLRLSQSELEAHAAWKEFGREEGGRPPAWGLMAAPLVARDGRNLGLVQLADKWEGDFSADDEAILVQLAQMGSVALENARLINELRKADRRKDEFLAMLAHELRNPLAPILSAAHVVRLTDPGDETLGRAGGQIERQARHLAHLVDDLLEVSRITQGKIRLTKEAVDLADAVGRAVETTRPLFDARRHWLSVNLPPHPVRLEADPLRLAQVLGNLLSNAAKYTEEGGRVWLTAEPDGTEVVVRVRDSGLGISADVLPHVFDPFTQADRTLDRSQGGLGIGLALVRSIVELHGGRVEARSEGPGQGSEFTVRLPKEAEPPALTPSAGSRRRPGSKKHLRVLVVEDNPDAADSLRMLLDLFGYEVTVARSGPEGVAAATRDLPDVVVCDIGLPGMDGYEVADAIRKNGRASGARLIAVTGYGRSEDLRRALQAGFNAHLIKPVDPEKLLEQLEPTGSC